MFGVDIHVVKDRGDACAANEGGKLVIKRLWPSMARTLWGDDKRFFDTYWNVIPNMYFLAGDGARCDEDGYFGSSVESTTSSMLPAIASAPRKSRARS